VVLAQIVGIKELDHRPPSAWALPEEVDDVCNLVVPPEAKEPRAVRAVYSSAIFGFISILLNVITNKIKIVTTS
jgi:hypothetical protein